MNIKTVLVTGCASGIGLSLADRLFRDGHRVMATDINAEALEAVAAERGWSRSKAVLLKTHDVRDCASWEHCVDALIEHWGQLDILMNIAGILVPGYTHEVDQGHVDKHRDINVKGVMVGTSVASAAMVRQGFGHIISMASLAGVTPVPGLAVYSGSKHAVRGFTLSAALDLAEHGVDVSVVCPDAVDTPMLDLQRDYEEAVLAFSGSRPLSVDDVVVAIVEEVMVEKTLEKLLAPKYTGRTKLARVVSVLPEVGARLGPVMRAVGRRQYKRRKRS